MTFPQGIKKVNYQKILLKKKSIVFFEFKSTFPQFKWRQKFSHLFKKLEKLIQIYHNRSLYNNEYIQIYLIYDNLQDLYNVKSMKSYANQKFSNLFTKFEFGLYYFSKGITILNNQILEKKLDDIFNVLKLIKDDNIQKELKKILGKK